MRVLKFGGSSLSTPAKILHVAKNLAKIHRRGEKLVVVVSAMGETTNQLLDLAKSISKNPNPRELDMLLTTGERVSMALLSMALHNLKCASISFTGSQAGILTDGSHFGAKIIDIKPTRVIEAVGNNQIVIVAGFQGVDPISKEITTLGRGGSDTSAVALATALKAKSCDLLKDIEHVCSADPKIVKKNRKYKTLDLRTLNEMCFWGAKVLHHRSVELALRNNVSLGIGSSLLFKVGTRIVSPEVKLSFEQQEVLAINSHRHVDQLFIRAKSLADAVTELEKTLSREKLTLPQILESKIEGSNVKLIYTSDQSHLDAIKNCGSKNKKIKFVKSSLSSVSLTCYGAIGSDLVSRALNILNSKGIHCEKFIAGPLSVTFFVEPDQRESAISTLHKLVKV